MRAYSLNRPVGMGTYPKPAEGDWEIENYGGRVYVDEIRRYAWGHVDYEADMAAEELDRYEMVTAEMCAAPKLPPEDVMRKMARLLADGDDDKAIKMFEKAEAKGFDGEAMDVELGRLLDEVRATA